MEKRKILRPVLAAVACGVLAFACVLFACSSGDSATTSADSVTGVSLPAEYGLTYGDTVSLSVEVTTSGPRYVGEIEWTTSDSSVAALFGAGGIVTACGVGEATVTASVPGTDYSASCLVTVTRGTFRVGVKDDVRGFGYMGDDGELYGMEIEMAGMMGDALGYDDISYVVVEPDDRESYLTNGYLDCVMATYTWTSERAEVVNFSSAYYTDSVAVLESAEYVGLGLGSLGEVSEYVCDLGEGEPDGSYAGGEITPCRVAYVEGSTAKNAFEEYCETSFIPTMNMYLGTEFFEYVAYGDYGKCEEALESGEADLFVSDRCILSTYMGGGTALLSDVLGEQRYCVATAKIDEEEDYVASDTSVSMSITAEVNALINEWIEEGVIAALAEKYGIAV